MRKLLLFDAAGTLFYLPRGVAAHYREVALRHGCDIPEASLGAAFKAAWQHLPPPEETRQRRLDDDRSWWRALVDLTLTACEVAPEALARDAYFDELYASFTEPGVWALFPDSAELLPKLREKYRLAIVSNFDGRIRSILEHLGVLEFFDPIVISSEHGADKPSAWLFHQALLAAGIPPHEALHIGDDLVCDVEGAQKAGIAAAHIDRPRQTLHDIMAEYGLLEG